MALAILVSSTTSSINAHRGLHWSFLSCGMLLLSFGILISATSIVLVAQATILDLNPRQLLGDFALNSSKHYM
ncbi:hypothetical protein L914_14095 [Phytophthora nicotianae]|uniref:Uncharacterized protein n=1 Tax=Phytophthora nicotianae TaxID=4792 RepID=W2MWH9_PHYNI|nr:hypothetical protein L914_14095 [Phytophthora nicotianae]